MIMCAIAIVWLQLQLQLQRSAAAAVTVTPRAHCLKLGWWPAGKLLVAAAS
eukprot:SAG11_NODE_354_length_10336_cov_3.789391_1_plen_51_part_10